MSARPETALLDAVNYKNGQKNHWRRTMWNSIQSRIPDRRNAIVLYLPGSTDLDRNEALRRGFSPANLIAIERDKLVVAELRAKGVTTICAGLLEIIQSWPRSHPPSVLIADMQCGMTEEVRRIIRAWSMNRSMEHTVLMLNVQRGRDAGYSLDVARASQTTEGYSMVEIFNRRFNQPLDSLQRNSMLAVLIINTWGDNWLRRFYPNVSLHSFSEWQRDQIRKQMQQNFRVRMLPLPSYRSTERSPYFDSILAWYEGPSLRNAPLLEGTELTRRKITAALAVRTMRMNGWLKQS